MRGQCVGYINGVIDTTVQTGKATQTETKSASFPSFCIDAGVHNGQIEEAVKKYLREHPGMQHYPADLLVRKALSVNFPCETGG